MLVKNTYGASIIPRKTNPNFLGQCRGSSLDRKKKETDKTESLQGNEQETAALRIKKRRTKLRSLSSRTKSKIKQKLYSLAGLNKKLTFLTLTFLNKVDD